MDTPAASATDTELLARFAGSADEAAFAEIVRRHSPLVLAVTRRRLGDSGFAEDAAQQVFIALARRVKQLREVPCLPAWLQRAAVYEAAAIARREARHQRRARRAGELASGADDPARGPNLDQALAALPARDRQILLLHHFERLGYTEIARRLETTAAAAQRRGHRALQRLAGLLKQGGSNESACAIWLAAGLAPRGTEIPAGFVARTLVLKKPATFALPWIPLVATLVLGGGAIATLQTPWPRITVAPTAASAPAPGVAFLPPRPEARKHLPKTPDEQLGADFQEFITRAKRDSKDAWEWVKARPEGAAGFLGKGTRHLADRDLPAAERLLDVIEGMSERQTVIAAIFTSRAEGNFESAIVWIDSFGKPDERESLLYIEAPDSTAEPEEEDYPGALKIARTSEVRQWLIMKTHVMNRSRDERVIEKLANELQGEDRRAALVWVAIQQLERNDPRAYETLDEAKPAQDMMIYPSLGSWVRDPQAVLDWIAAQTDGKPRHSMVTNLWRDWAETDAAAAAAWALEANRKGGAAGATLVPEDPVTKRLMTPP